MIDKQNYAISVIFISDDFFPPFLALSFFQTVILQDSDKAVMGCRRKKIKNKRARLLRVPRGLVCLV